MTKLLFAYSEVQRAIEENSFVLYHEKETYFDATVLNEDEEPEGEILKTRPKYIVLVENKEDADHLISEIKRISDNYNFHNRKTGKHVVLMNSKVITGTDSDVVTLSKCRATYSLWVSIEKEIQRLQLKVSIIEIKLKALKDENDQKAINIRRYCEDERRKIYALMKYQQDHPEETKIHIWYPSGVCNNVSYFDGIENRRKTVRMGDLLIIIGWDINLNANTAPRKTRNDKKTEENMKPYQIIGPYYSK